MISMDLSLRDLRNDIAHREFNELESQAMSGFVNQAIDASKEMKKSQEKYSKLSDDILSLMIKNKLLTKQELGFDDVKAESKMYTDAVDGSMQPYTKPDGNTISFLSAATITFPNGYTSEAKVKIIPKISVVDEVDPKIAASKAEDEMMALEMYSMRKVVEARSEGGILFLDGPIMDPPNRIPETDPPYEGERAGIIREAIRKKISVIGIVKRIYGDSFTKHYSKNLSAPEQAKFTSMSSDKNLLVYTMTKFLSEKADRECIAVSKPIRLDHQIAKKYHDRGIDIWTFILKNGYSSPPIRIEIPTLADSGEPTQQMESAVRSIVAWSAPRRQIPVPVLLAHEKCNIKQGAADVLYNEFMTRLWATDDEDDLMVFLQNSDNKGYNYGG